MIRTMLNLMITVNANVLFYCVYGLMFDCWT